MDEIKLEEWQRLTIQSLAGERERVAQRAQETVKGINATLKHYSEEWAGEEGLFEFDQRPDGLYLVSKNETELAPTT